MAPNPMTFIRTPQQSQTGANFLVSPFGGRPAVVRAVIRNRGPAALVTRGNPPYTVIRDGAAPRPRAAHNGCTGGISSSLCSPACTPMSSVSGRGPATSVWPSHLPPQTSQQYYAGSQPHLGGSLFVERPLTTAPEVQHQLQPQQLQHQFQQQFHSTSQPMHQPSPQLEMVYRTNEWLEKQTKADGGAYFQKYCLWLASELARGLQEPLLSRMHVALVEEQDDAEQERSDLAAIRAQIDRDADAEFEVKKAAIRAKEYKKRLAREAEQKAQIEREVYAEEDAKREVIRKRQEEKLKEEKLKEDIARVPIPRKKSADR